MSDDSPSPSEPPSNQPEPESMEYGMLGRDDSSNEEKIEKFTGDIAWSYLQPHFEAGVLLWVDPELDLAEVGRALTEDDVDRVQAWLGTGDLIKPSDLHVAQWVEGEKNGEMFIATVVSPFVLMQSPKE